MDSFDSTKFKNVYRVEDNIDYNIDNSRFVLMEVDIDYKFKQ